MRKFLGLLSSTIVIGALLVSAYELCAQENPYKPNLFDRIGLNTEHGLHGAVPEENIDLFTGNVTLSIGNTEAIKTAIHELGHADQAGRNLAQYYIQAAMYKDSRGKLLPHNERPLEIYAGHYVNRILPSWRR